MTRAKQGLQSTVSHYVEGESGWMNRPDDAIDIWIKVKCFSRSEKETKSGLSIIKLVNFRFIAFISRNT